MLFCTKSYDKEIQRLRQQERSSCWDGRPFGHNRHGPKSGGCCAPFRGGSWIPI